MVLCASTGAGHLYKEKEYQSVWCSEHGGITEYVLDDRSRVDCLLPDIVVEFDFAAKWAESIGQAIYYGLKTNKKPAIVLILENPQKDKKYLKRLKKVADTYGITVYSITPKHLTTEP
ncbi:MAG: hypothetical protein H7844_06460 [Nitrospirae bacterium YQR-1]